MSIYRKADVRMWNDANVRALSPPPPCGQSLWVRLLIGAHTGLIPGLSATREGGLAGDLGWELEAFREAFREVSGEAFAEGLPGSPKQLAKADWDAGLLWVPGALKRNAPQSPNVVKSWADAWDMLPECDLKIEAYQHIKAFMEGMGKGFQEAFHKAIPKPSWKVCPYQEQEQEQEQEQDPPHSPPGGESGFAVAPVADPVPLPVRPYVEPMGQAPCLWDRYDDQRRGEYLAELADAWPGLPYPRPLDAQRLAKHLQRWLAGKPAAERRELFESLRDAVRSDKYAKRDLVQHLLGADLGGLASSRGACAHDDVVSHADRVAAGEIGVLEI